MSNCHKATSEMAGRIGYLCGVLSRELLPLMAVECGQRLNEGYCICAPEIIEVFGQYLERTAKMPRETAKQRQEMIMLFASAINNTGRDIDLTWSEHWMQWRYSDCGDICNAATRLYQETVMASA